jgi:hypothetical protein
MVSSMHNSKEKLFYVPKGSPVKTLVTKLKKQGVDVIKKMDFISPERQKTIEDAEHLLKTPQGSLARRIYQNDSGTLVKHATPDDKRVRSNQYRLDITPKPAPSAPADQSLEEFFKSKDKFLNSKHRKMIDPSTIGNAKKRKRASPTAVMKGKSSSFFSTPVEANWGHVIGHCLGGSDKQENLLPVTRAANLTTLSLVERPILTRLKSRKLKVEQAAQVVYGKFAGPEYIKYELSWFKPTNPVAYQERVIVSARSCEAVSPKLVGAIELLREHGLSTSDSTLPAPPSVP